MNDKIEKIVKQVIKESLGGGNEMVADEEVVSKVTKMAELLQGASETLLGSIKALQNGMNAFARRLESFGIKIIGSEFSDNGCYFTLDGQSCVEYMRKYDSRMYEECVEENADFVEYAVDSISFNIINDKTINWEIKQWIDNAQYLYGQYYTQMQCHKENGTNNITCGPVDDIEPINDIDDVVKFFLTVWPTI